MITRAFQLQGVAIDLLRLDGLVEHVVMEGAHVPLSRGSGNGREIRFRGLPEGYSITSCQGYNAPMTPVRSFRLK